MKRIAVIYEEQNIFMVVRGDYYNYSFSEHGIKSHKMDARKQKQFLFEISLTQKRLLIV